MTPYYATKVENYHFNVIKDFNKENNFSPYIGLGADTTKIDIASQTITIMNNVAVPMESENIDVFSWALTGCISYNVNESTSLFWEANYIKTSEFNRDIRTILNDDAISIKDNYDSISKNNLLAGVRFRF